jgi:hypothetical protein
LIQRNAFLRRSLQRRSDRGLAVRRILESIAVIVIASNLVGCAKMIAQNAAQTAVTEAVTCFKDVRSSPEGQIVYARAWANDDSDTADKLTDSKPLTKDERNALVKVHNKMQACRQIIIAHDNKFAAWETPYWQDLFQRGDAIFYKTAGGEISVGLANKLTIESVGKFQADVSRGHADAVRVEEAQRQRAAEAMMQSGTQLLIASQPRSQITTTNCSWMGNTLNCTSVR